MANKELFHKESDYAIPGLLKRGESNFRRPFVANRVRMPPWRPKTVNTSSTNAKSHIMSLYSTAFSSTKTSAYAPSHTRNQSHSEIRAPVDVGSTKTAQFVTKVIKVAPIVNDFTQK